MRSHAPIAVVATGLVLIAVGLLAQQIMPLLGRVAFQAAAAGSYSPTDYRLHLDGYYVVAAVVILLGIGAFIAELRPRR